jgi:uncharacterized protein YeaO (DUF488 family)
MTEIKAVRIYSHEQPAGYRILVDRLWPRGMSKEKAQLDEWDKEMAPSSELRKWFKHDPSKFAEFKQRYVTELQQNEETGHFVETVKEKLQQQDVLFLYGAKDEQHNQAVVLKEYIENLE